MMTIQEQVEKTRRAKELIEEVLDGMGEGGELYDLAAEALVKVRRVYLRLKAERSKQPLGIK